MIGCVVCEGVVDFDQHWWRMDIERFGGRCLCWMCRMQDSSRVSSLGSFRCFRRSLSLSTSSFFSSLST